MRRALALILAFAAAPAAAQAPPQSLPWALPQLMSGLAGVPSATARFTERKTIEVLDSPLIDSGTLSYTAPDTVRKTTETPVPEDFLLSHGTITMSGGIRAQPQSIPADGDPRIGGTVEGIRATLAGDLPALQRLYTIGFSGQKQAWQLVLRPRGAALRSLIQWMLVRGQDDRITEIDTLNANGDHTEMGVDETVGGAR